MKFTYLIAIATLMIISVAAMAQGGSAPFVGSTHEYKVTPGASGNAYTWVISGGAGSSGYTINSATSGTTGTGEITLSITWNTASATDYTISFTETTPAPASCSTVKEIDVTVGTNNFDVNIGSLTDACNNNSGSVSPADSATSIITIPFDMETGTTWGPNWEVAFNLAVTSSNARILSVALSSGASGTLNDLSGGNYSITGITSSAVTGTGTTSIEVEVKGYSFTDVTVDVEITSAIENEYNTPAASTGSWSAETNTIYQIPNTSDITTD